MMKSIFLAVCILGALNSCSEPEPRIVYIKVPCPTLTVHKYEKQVFAPLQLDYEVK